MCRMQTSINIGPNGAILGMESTSGRFFLTALTGRGRLIPMNRAILIRATALALIFFARFQPLNADAQDCTGKLAPSDQRRCEDMFARKVEAGSRTSQLAGGWRLVNT